MPRITRPGMTNGQRLAQINRCGGNISRTAAFIGMERSALHRELCALGVSSDQRTGDVRP